MLVALEEIDALNDREALTEEDRWLLPPSCVFQLHPLFATDAPSSRHVVHRCVRGERCVRVSVRATIAQLPDFGVFLAPLRLSVRGSWL